MSAKRKVICLQTGIIYGSLTEAAVATSGHASAISRACNGERVKASGFCWGWLDEILPPDAGGAECLVDRYRLRKLCDMKLAEIAMHTVYGGVK